MSETITATGSAASGRDALTPRRKTIILATCCMSLLIVSMDMTIVNVALPAIHRDLSASMSSLQWVIDIYTLVLASLLMISGTTADRFGRKRVFQIGLTIFAIGSLLCSLAPTAGLLIGARAVQAVGGSMLNPVAMSIITQVFRDPRERARAVGVWGAVVGISMAVGPIVGGALIEYVSWRAVFWINLPICALAVALAAIFIPESKSTTTRTLDPVGQALAIITLGGLVYALIEGPGLGWSSPVTIGVLVMAAAACATFIWWERRVSDPFIDLGFFRSVPFSSATVVAMCGFASYGGFLFLISQYLQSVRGLSAISTGLMLIPLAVTTLVFSPLSGRLVGRYGTRPSLVASGVFLLVGAALLTTVDAHTSTSMLLVTFGVVGVGMGLINAPITTSAVSGMPRDRAGAAGAVASTSRQIGVSIGVALAGSITGAVAAQAAGDAFADAMRPMWMVMMGLAAVIVVLAIVSTTRRAVATAYVED
ncbi:MFS transporter [Gordonia jinhuaensis]|uniref:MFS transporter n=1 Tax=Gordonia jinhuaensis TaxID=1517702 RepID=A0A916SWN3_9ACTN|nr:MFS transporter [Gordonia jinhuaensis]GGB17126.1 MFS transporter [Gordonia jinhuaensis]